MNTSYAHYPHHRYDGLSKLRHRQCGLTLVEVLVALMISAFLLAGVIQLFIGSKQTYSAQDAMARIQENGRFALESMARDIRMAGYYPRVTTTTTAGTGTEKLITRTQNAEPDWDLKNPDDNSSVNQPLFGVSSTTNPSATSISVQWRNEADTAFFTRRYSTAARSNTASAGGFTCPGAANSLFLEQDSGTPQELIEGVQLMRIFYGEDTNPALNPGGRPSVPRVYRTADQVANWGNVVSVQIHLLLVSLQDNLTTAGSQTVMFPSATSPTPIQTTVSSRCLGQAFSSTIAIRNF